MISERTYESIDVVSVNDQQMFVNCFSIRGITSERCLVFFFWSFKLLMNKVILVFWKHLLRVANSRKVHDEQGNLTPTASIAFINRTTFVDIFPHSLAREWSPAIKYCWRVTADLIHTEAFFKYFITDFLYRIYINFFLKKYLSLINIFGNYC